MPFFPTFLSARSVPLALCLSAALLGGCATPEPGQLPARTQQDLLPTDVLLLGEQHDAPEHQALQQDTVQWLAGRGELAALVLEMAERGRSTAGLAADANERAVQSALRWSDAAWPWASYGPVAMAAVRAGVPVLGGNLPRARMRAAMQDSALDTRLPPAAWAEQRERIREGHCGLLPESQITPMTRVQIARDMAMADTVVRALQPGRTVLLVAGNGHVQRGLGVPLHLPPKIKAKVVSARSEKALPATNNIAATASGHDTDLVWPTAPQPPRDYCAELRRTGGGAPGAPGAPGTPDAPPHPDTLPHQ